MFVATEGVNLAMPSLTARARLRAQSTAANAGACSVCIDPLIKDIWIVISALSMSRSTAQFEAFARGFMMLCGGPAIHLFSATELERLVCGTPLLDFGALQRNARYEGGYSATHQVG